MTALEIVQKFHPRVRTVRDARKPLMIEVTEEDVKSRAVKNHKECALAQACKRSETLDGAIIAVRVAYLVKGDVATRYQIPESIAREIVSFDRSGGFLPGIYELKKSSHKLGERRGTETDARTRRRKRVKFQHVTAGIRQLRLK